MTLSEPPVAEESHSSSSRPVAESEAESAQRGFSQSVVVSGIRCVLTYLIFPFVFPTALGSVGPVLGLVVGSIALASNGFSIRRFWRAQHKWRKPITVIHVGVIALLLFLMVRDIQQLLG